MKIIDDIFPEQFQNYLENLFFLRNFPWYFIEKTVAPGEGLWDKNTKEAVQLSHSLVMDSQPSSQHWANIQPIVPWIMLKENIEIKNVSRVKVNLTLPDVNHINGNHLPAHTDIDIKPDTLGLTAIYYVNDSDGDTIFFKDQKNPNDELEEISRVSPKKGRLVLFNCNTLHAGCLPEKTARRCVLNLNFVTG